LTFGTAHGNESVAINSDDDGIFRGAIPRVGAWIVTVSATSPQIKRDISVNVEGNDVPIDIKMPENVIDLEVVDEQGQPQPDTVLRTLRMGSQPTSTIVAGGKTSLAGLDDGDYEIRARARGFASATYHLTVKDGSADRESLRIVLRPTSLIRGRVLNATGDQVINASVYLTSLPPPSQPLDRSASTDADGRFQASVPNGMSRVCAVISSDSATARTLQLDVQPSEQVIRMPPVGGTLTLDFPATGASVLEGRFAILFAAGCSYTPSALVGAVSTSGDRKTVRVVIEPGFYRLCSTSYQDLRLYGGGVPNLASCVAGELRPLSQLNLQLLP